jgi:hypothetical protein
VCVRERYRENRDEALIRELRFKGRTPPFSSGSASWGFLVSRSWLATQVLIGFTGGVQYHKD